MSNNLKIVSFNLRNPWMFDGINAFINRSGRILNKIDEESPDVVCFQECTEKLRDFFARHLSYNYDFHYQGRHADLDGEGLAFAIKKASVELIEMTRFWLSPTPHVAASRFEEQSKCPRICQCLLLRTKADNYCFRVYNTHLDHISDKARILGITAVMEKVKADFDTAPYPVYIMGDFNAEPDSEPISFCNNYKEFPIYDLTTTLSRTFHQFGELLNTDKTPCKIDYIFCDEETAKKPYKTYVWDEEIAGIFLSDHFPVCLEIEI